MRHASMRIPAPKSPPPELMLTPPCEWPPFQTMLPDTSGFSNACAGAEQGMRMLDNPANMTQVIIMRVFIFPPPFSIEPAKQSSARPQPSLPSFIRPVRHEYSRRFNAVCIVELDCICFYCTREGEKIKIRVQGTSPGRHATSAANSSILPIMKAAMSSSYSGMNRPQPWCIS